MPYVKLDDGFPDHPKVLAAGPLAAWLYVCGLSYASRYLTDGFIPTMQIARLADVKQADKLAQRLVDAGLWEHADGGYQIHDYLHYQTPSANVERKREEARERMRRLREREQEEARSQDVRANNSRSSREVRSTHTRATEYRVQNTDTENRTPPSGGETSPAPAHEALPIPPDLELTDDDEVAAIKCGVPVEGIADEWKHFKGHYIARQNERRTDWHAQWVSWLGKRDQFPTRTTLNGTTPKRKESPPPPGVVSRSDGDRQRQIIGR